MTRHLGLDLGGTNLKWVGLEPSGSDWSRVAGGETPTRAAQGPEGVVAEMVEVGRAAQRESGPFASVGVGVPGMYDPVSGATRFLPNLPGDWAGVPVGPTLAEELGVSVHLINDARAFTLAELRLGAGRGARTIVGLTLGTGVGGGVAIDGRLHLGHDGTAGELGHQTLVMGGGELCTCGNRGCLETLVKAAAIARACGQPTVEAAVGAARSGDERALAGLAEAGRHLGVGVCNVLVTLTPDRVIIGGGVAAAGDLLLEPVRRELYRRVHVTDLTAVQVVAAELGIWAGAVGAALHGSEAAATTTL